MRRTASPKVMKLPVYCLKTVSNSRVTSGKLKPMKSKGPHGAKHSFQSDEKMALYRFFTNGLVAFSHEVKELVILDIEADQKTPINQSVWGICRQSSVAILTAKWRSSTEDTPPIKRPF
jgi:hypothetical protein